jgi:hypothetical protein
LLYLLKSEKKKPLQVIFCFVIIETLKFVTIVPDYGLELNLKQRFDSQDSKLINKISLVCSPIVLNVIGLFVVKSFIKYLRYKLLLNWFCLVSYLYENIKEVNGLKEFNESPHFKLQTVILQKAKFPLYKF